MKSLDSVPAVVANPPVTDKMASDPEELFELYFDCVFRFFSRRVRSREDAQDLTAETFAALVRERPPRDIEPLCWLYGIGRRKLADWLRRQGRTAIPPAQSESENSRAQALRAIIERLPQDQREALLLQALEDLSIAQIAKVMHRSPKSVKALLQRARERVRKDSKGEFNPEVGQ